MELEINEELIVKLKQNLASGQTNLTLDKLNELYEHLKDKKTKAIVVSGRCYIIFAELPKIEFQISDFKNKKDLSFISSNLLTYVDTSKLEVSYFRFLLNEFLQGKTFFSRAGRLVSTLLPLIFLNGFIVTYSTMNSVQQTFAGLLTAVSVFVAIFSLFTISHEYLSRKRLGLFEGGQLGYYFSIDRHIAKTGVLSIILSIFGLLASTSLENGKIININIFMREQGLVVIILLNMAFLGVFIILRSILEFYISRPGAFIMGDLKRVSFNQFIKNL